MDLRSSSRATTEAGETARLRRQLARERARRRTAEMVGQQATAELSDTVQQLRSVQSELLERADQSAVVNGVARALRQDLDSAQLVRRAAESVGSVTSVDRCDVLLVDTDLSTASRGSWVGSRAAARLPGPRSFSDLPDPLRAIFHDAARHLASVQVDRLDADPRLTPACAAEVQGVMRVQALLGVPLAVGEEVVGWLLLQSEAPRAWTARDLAICKGVAHDLVASLVQVRAYEQQRESVRRLEELDRAKDAFISTVSHELRTPLSSIVGYVELLADGGFGELDATAAQGLAVIERNAERLQNLVDDLLTLSAYDAAHVRLDLRPVDLEAVVGDCFTSLAPAAAGRDLELVVDAEPALPPALADHQQIERVVLNLLSNAAKFSHDGGRITARLRRVGDQVGLDVVDTGIGVPAAEVGRLFTRFFRSSLSTAGEIQGTGLGLALVQAVVEWHGGTVGVESVEGEGTTVSVRLPRSR